METARLAMTIEEEHTKVDLRLTDAAQAKLSQILIWLRSGEEPAASNAASELARRFQPLMRRFWREHAGGAYEDFVQEVLLRLFRAFRRDTDVQALPGLLKRIVVGVAADYWRSQAKHELGREQFDPAELDIAFQEEIAPAVAMSVLTDNLSPREREVVEMSFVADMDTVNIASALGVSEGAVRMTRARALRRLRKLLLAEGRKNLQGG